MTTRHQSIVVLSEKDRDVVLRANILLTNRFLRILSINCTEQMKTPSASEFDQSWLWSVVAENFDKSWHCLSIEEESHEQNKVSTAVVGGFLLESSVHDLRKYVRWDVHNL